MKSIITILVCVLGVLIINCGSPFVEGAKVYIQQEDWERALEQLKIEVENNPVNGEAYFLMGQVYAEMDSFERMAVVFDKALEYSPAQEGEINKWRESKWVKAFNRGVNAGQKQRYEDAIKWTETAVFIDSTKAEGWTNLGFFYGKNGNVEAAKKAYIKSFALYPSDLEVGMVLVRFYLNEENNEKALEILNQLEKDHPDDPDITIQKGAIYLNKDELDNAIEALEKGKESNPDNRIVLYNLGMAYYRKQEFEKASENFMGVVENSDDEIDDLYKDALLGWGGTLYELGKYAEAEQRFRSLLEINPEHSNAWEHLGTTLAKLGNTTEGEFAYNYGRALYFIENEEWESAVKFLKEAISANDKSLPAWEKLKSLYERLGDDKEAENAAKKIEELK